MECCCALIAYSIKGAGNDSKEPEGSNVLNFNIVNKSVEACQRTRGRFS